MAQEVSGVSHQVSSDDRVSITMMVDGDAPEASVFATDSPPRIVVDLPGTASAVDGSAVSVGSGVIRQYATLSAGGRTRLVVDLSDMAEYEVTQSGNSVVLHIEGGGATRVVSGSSASSGAAASSGGNLRLTDIDFRRGEEGQSRVVASFNRPGASLSVNERGDHLVVTVLNATVDDDQRRQLDVVDFATPVQYINTDNRGSAAQIDLTIRGDFEHLAYQTGNDVVVEVSERVAPPEEENNPNELSFFQDREYEGSRVTFNFQDIEVRSVLSLIADVSDLNIVVADSVTGNITLRLTNVPWDQALDIVLDARNLDKRQNGNVIWIAPVAEIAAREQQLLTALKQRQTLEPLQTAMIQLSYSKASAVKTLIEESRTNAAASDDEGLLSERGSVTIDERTNTLLVNDTPEKIAEIRALIRELDIPVQQVQIESRIVIARSDFQHELGVRFGATAIHAGSNVGVVGATGEGVDTTLFSLIGPDADGTALVPNQPGRYNVNLPVANPAGSLAVSFLTGDYLLDLELSALESEGQGEVISAPRVITANQAEAFIQQGVEIPYQQSTSSGATAVQFKDAVLELRVTPLITPDDRVQMDLEVKQDTVGEIFVLQNGAQIPAIDTRELGTSVLVNNGETIVLGGIYQDEKNYTEDKVPGLGNLPVIGAAFRKRSTENQKRELLIFITPTILKLAYNPAN